MKTLLDYIEKWCELTPNATAIITPNETLSYQQLDQYSDAVAEFLYNENIGIGDIVPIEATRSTNFLVGLLGIMKTGAAYSPIDYAYPEQRKEYIIQQTRASLVLTSIPKQLVETTGVRKVSIASLRSEESKKRLSQALPDEPIYVIFTSGTTGQPKGVIVEHHSVEEFVSWHNKTFSVNQSTRSTLMAALGFDVAHWEIWSPLIAGGTLCMFDDETRRDINLLINGFIELEITHAFIPTVMVYDVVAASHSNLSSLIYLFTGGEKLNPIDTDHVNYQLIDYYGPTEASIWITYHPVSSSTQNKPQSIGKPRENVQILILNEKLQELPEGEIGEIFIAGNCLARGYLDNDTQTNEKFLTHPYDTDKRIYRTGDLGKKLPDGSTQFLGRLDEQVKIRGNLVELTEIETVIAHQSSVNKVSIISPKATKNEPREIVAFIILDDEVKNDNDAIHQIRQKAAAFLPDYMMPSQYIIVEDFPKNSHGKRIRLY